MMCISIKVSLHKYQSWCVTGTTLGQQAIASYNAALSTRTHKNRLRQATMYLTFALQYGAEIYNPSVPECCLYQQYLANTLKSPLTRDNYTSGAKLWIEERGGNGDNLRSHQANYVAKGAQRLSPHIPNPAPPLMPADLVKACIYIDKAGYPVLKAALTLGYFAFLRCSNLLSPTAIMWGGPHTLLRGDIVAYPHGLQVTIRSSKTITPGTIPTVLMLPRIQSSPACPAAAWESYTSRTPARDCDLAFTLQDGTPLTTTQLVLVLKEALASYGCPYAQDIKSHSMRRGGAQAAVAAGCDREDVAAHGTWASVNGLKAYVPSQSSFRVSAALSTLFAP